MHYMMIRRMYFVDGWPVFAPEAYTEETSARVVNRELALELADMGNWEIIEFSNTNNEMVFSKVSKFTDEFLSGVYGTAFDFENQGECYYVSGYLKNGNTVWMKKYCSAELIQK